MLNPPPQLAAILLEVVTCLAFLVGSVLNSLLVVLFCRCDYIQDNCRIIKIIKINFLLVVLICRRRGFRTLSNRWLSISTSLFILKVFMPIEWVFFEDVPLLWSLFLRFVVNLAASNLVMGLLLTPLSFADPSFNLIHPSPGGLNLQHHSKLTTCVHSPVLRPDRCNHPGLPRHLVGNSLDKRRPVPCHCRASPLPSQGKQVQTLSWYIKGSIKPKQVSFLVQSSKQIFQIVNNCSGDELSYSALVLGSSLSWRQWLWWDLYSHSYLMWQISNLFFQVGQPGVVPSLLPFYRTCSSWTNSTNFELQSTSTSAYPATSPMINSSIETSSLPAAHTESTMQTQAVCYALLFLHVLPFIG